VYSVQLQTSLEGDASHNCIIDTQLRWCSTGDMLGQWTTLCRQSHWDLCYECEMWIWVCSTWYV